MATRRLLISFTVIVIVLAWVGLASALSISFLEPLGPTGNIEVTRDPAIGIISTSSESATLTIGDTTTNSTVLARIGFTQPGSMHMEGGGQGVSDILTLTVFFAVGTPAAVPVGFQASFQSDPDSTERGLPNPGNLTALIVETGAVQHAFSGSVALPSVGDLTVNVRSDLDAVPEPASLLLLGSGLMGLAGVAWRRRRK